MMKTAMSFLMVMSIITATNIRMDMRMNMDAAIVVITSVREAVQKKW